MFTPTESGFFTKKILQKTGLTKAESEKKNYIFSVILYFSGNQTRWQRPWATIKANQIKKANF